MTLDDTIISMLDRIREAQFRDRDMLRKISAQMADVAAQQEAFAATLEAMTPKRSDGKLSGFLQEVFGTERAITVKLIIIGMAAAYMAQTGQADKLASLVLGM